ncbi:polysaccharide deacetylase family protein [Bacteriovoracaceae bacterium]|nr:polysaccharide deacetylase family protein [Bacteriovoracaceae bacterium]
MKTFLLFFIYTSFSFGQWLDPNKGFDIFDPKNIYKFELEKTKQLVLTIDDGPTAKVTKNILDSLKLYANDNFRVNATFFLIGEKLGTNNIELLERMIDEDHIIANHTLTHPKLARLRSSSGKIDKKTALKELIITHEKIIPFLPEVNDINKKWYFRAPFGNWAPFLAGIYNEHPDLKNYIGPLFWNIGGQIIYRRDTQGKKYLADAADWDCWRKKLTPLTCATGYLNAIKRKQGGVILLHDIKINSAELVRYLLVAISGRNLFEDKKYDRILEMYPNQFPEYYFISLDEIEALNKWDKRFEFL